MPMGRQWVYAMNTNSYTRQIYAVSIILFFIAFILWLWNFMVDESIYNSPKELHDASVEAIKFIGQFLAGIVVLVGVYATWRRMTALERSNEIALDGQVTDRFVKAVELLGKESTQEILGGVYALERIANDSPNDYWPIMEILTAYVREAAPYPVPVNRTPRGEEPLKRNTTVVQCIIDVLCRRNNKYDDGQFNLSHTDLNDIVFGALDAKVYLNRFNFTGSNINHCTMTRCTLKNPIFIGADLSSALILGSVIIGGGEIFEFDAAIFDGAILKDVIFKNADLRLAKDLQSASFIDCEYEGKTNIPGVYPTS